MKKKQPTISISATDFLLQNPSLILIVFLILMLIAMSQRYAIEIGPVKLTPIETVKK